MADHQDPLLTRTSSSITASKKLGCPEEFALSQGYRPSPRDLEFTLRAAIIGGGFAFINALVNMFFAFRYAGGLAQYWVILLAYPVARLFEKFPLGSCLNPGPFSAKEHCIVMTIAIAGSLAGTLGLSGGMLSLNLYFNTRLTDLQIFTWAIIAGFFGLFFGNFFFQSLVLPDQYEWPFSKVNAAFIAAFYSSEDDAALDAAEEDEDRVCCGRSISMLSIFGIFFSVAFIWFVIPNYFMPLLFTMSVLCWFPHSWTPVQPFGRGGVTRDLLSVLSSGEAGAGMPGIGGWASAWAFGPSIIPFETTVQIVIGIILTYWIFIPIAFFSGIAAWPSSFREFDKHGHLYNQTEGHYAEAGADPVYLSGVGMTMYIGVFLGIIGMLSDTITKMVAPKCCNKNNQGDIEKDEDDIRSRGTSYGSNGSNKSNQPASKQQKHHERWRKQSLLKLPSRQPPVPFRINVIVVALLSFACVCVVEFVFPKYRGQTGIGMPIWGTVVVILYSFCCAYGCSIIYATVGQQFSGGVCILLQVLFGFLVPGSARANVIAVMLCNTIVSQSLGILSDYKTALYLQVKPRSMFFGQLLGAGIGVVVSSAVFIFVLFLNDTHRIKLGSAEWPAVGAVSQTLNAKIFGEQGPSAGKFLFINNCFLFFLSSFLGSICFYNVEKLEKLCQQNSTGSRQIRS
jgi:OPT family oligopeptide transporter